MDSYSEVWLVDFEFSAPPGERPRPVCLVAWEVHSGRSVRLSGDQLQRTAPPYDIGPSALFVAYYASAELGCHLALGWDMPVNVLDLFAEFKWLTNGLPTIAGGGLLGALRHFGLDGIGGDEKTTMRDLAMRGGPYTDAESVALLDYCETDVAALSRLYPAMRPRLDLPRALVRGRYMAAVARIEWTGVPLDVGYLDRLRDKWSTIQAKMISRVDQRYGVYEGNTFKIKRWARWLATNRIQWPLLPTGQLALDRDIFRAMAKSHPAIAPMYELRTSLSQLRLIDLPVGGDSRNRCLLSPFSSRTGRNQPSTTKFIFGPSAWIRGLIKPGPGRGVAYVDWGQQEFGAAAALSGDEAMLEAYSSGDPYLAFGQQAGAIPPDGTKHTHEAERNLFKACVLAVQYGMEKQSLAIRISGPVAKARQLLQLHREAYPTFWRWSEASVNHANLMGSLDTVFGWRIQYHDEVNGRSQANYPMQANGAEMLRLACIAATEQGVEVCAPVHDALLIEAPLDKLQEAISVTQRAMQRASAAVLGGFELRTDATVVRYPDRYMDDRGSVMWDIVQEIVKEAEAAETAV